MNLLKAAETVARVVVGLILTLFFMASFLWLPTDARVIQIFGVGTLLVSLTSLSRPRLSSTLALAGSILLSGMSYLAVSDVWLAVFTGLTAFGATLLPIFLGSIDARRNRPDRTEGRPVGRPQRAESG